MKKIVRLTESDLMRIVKRVLNEQEEKTLTKKQFETFLSIGRPIKYEKGNFISINWNDPKQPGDNIITLTYREGDNGFDIILSDKLKGKFCNVLNKSSQYLKNNGGVGSYSESSDTCGGQFYFDVKKFPLLKEILTNLNLMIFK